MNILHRELAPISAEGWGDLEEEARRTFRRHVAGRRVVDVPEPAGIGLASVGTGHLDPVEAPRVGMIAHLRRSQPIAELRVPFEIDRQHVDDVARGARDTDWQPVKDALRQLAFAEDGLIFQGYPAARITGIRNGSSPQAIPLPAEVQGYPAAISRAVTGLRLAGVGGPYSLVLDADAYTAVNGGTNDGYPIHDHISRVLDGEIIWAPAIEGAVLVSVRGGDFELRIGQDVSIGYLSHDATRIQLYAQETVTFLVHTPEAAVSFMAVGRS